ncbi:MAG: outer membrane protein assembly factor BamD [Bacteroidales bacterium]|nr:outer membrane protein assembly factor BamD [Bacteroidales bacterium]
MKKLLYILLVLSLAACSDFEKIRRSTDTYFRYRKAMEYYNNGEYSKASQLFADLTSAFRGTAQQDSVLFFQAMSMFKQGEGFYENAAYFFKTFTNDYRYSAFAEDAALMEAECYYLQSNRPELDQTQTYMALNAFEIFKLMYPQSQHRGIVNAKISELNEKLVEKSYLSAKLYFDLQEYKAALTALRNALRDYPDTKYRESLQYMLLKSHYLYAYNSVDSKKQERFQATLDEYLSFISEHPESAYAKDVEKIRRITERYLSTHQLEEDTDEASSITL